MVATRRSGGEWGDAFRERLRALIDELGDSQAAFARRCGVESPRISEWLSGSQLPSADALRAIAQGSNVSLDWLLVGVGGDAPAIRSSGRNVRELDADVRAYVLHLIGEHFRAPGFWGAEVPTRAQAERAGLMKRLEAIEGRSVLTHIAAEEATRLRNEIADALAAESRTERARQLEALTALYESPDASEAEITLAEEIIRGWLAPRPASTGAFLAGLRDRVSSQSRRSSQPPTIACDPRAETERLPEEAWRVIAAQVSREDEEAQAEGRARAAHLAQLVVTPPPPARR